MNRKLFNGLLLLTVATGGVGTFTSCKDTEQDFRNEVLVGQQDLSEQIAAIRNLTDDTFKNKLDAEIQRLIDADNIEDAAKLVALKNEIIGIVDGRLRDLEAAYIAADDALKAEINNRVDNLLSSLEATLKAYTDTSIENLRTEIQGDITNLTNTVTGISTKVTELETKLTEADAKAQEALDLAKKNETAVEGMRTDLDNLTDQYGTLQGELNTLNEKVTAIENKYDGLFEELNNVVDNLSTQIEGIGTQIESIGTQIEGLSTQIDGLNTDMDNLRNEILQIQEYLKRFVSGLIVEQTYNPVFGTLNLPIGIQSNMLVNYYALSDGDVMFPNGAGRYEYGDNETTFGTKGFILPFEAEKVLSGGEPKLESLGNLYMTINPIQRSFDGLGFQLVKSNGDTVPGEFRANASTDVLSFGYTRADSPNGFYKAQIVPTGSDEELIKAIKVEIEDGLKTAFKDAVKNHTKQDFVELAKLLYKQFDGILPAYAAKVSWTADDEKGIKKSVLSGYDLAVTTFRPLSYSTGFGVGLDKQLPTFGSLQSIVDNVFETIKGELDLGLEGVGGLDDVTITIENLEFKIEPTTITIEIPALEIKDGQGNSTWTEPTSITLGYDGGEVSVPGDNNTALNDLISQIQNAVEDMISGDGGLIDQINQQIKDKIVGQVNSMIADINEQLEGVQNKIYDSIDGIQDKINAQLNGTLGQTAQNLIDLYNRFAEKINNIIENPNAYLQVVMAYEGVDGNIHHLSTVESDPTYVSPGAIQLFMTSYNAEIIVPSYKKYVAITKAGSDTNTAELNAKVNGEKNGLNQVLSGNQQSLAFDASKLTPGVTYEIFYQSLDFRGYTSTRTYYIRVK